MEDRVAEVLAQRAALDRSAGTGIAVSVALHAALTTLAVWVALHQPPPALVNTLTIRFAPNAPVTVRPVRKELPRLVEPKPAVEEPKPAVPPVPQKQTAPPSPFGRSTKRAGAVEPPPPVPAAASAAQSGAGIAVGSAGVTGLEGGDFPYTLYIENMKRLIGSRWFRPQVTGTPETTIYFVINRDGTIRDARTETAAGVGTFDRAALRSVLEASPLPPLPMSYSGSYLGVHLTFK